MHVRVDWSGIGFLVATCAVAVVLTAWQSAGDRSVFEPYLGRSNPVVAMLVASTIGVVTMAHLQASSRFAVIGPGGWREAAATVVWVVPLLAAVAIAADVVLRFDEDVNVVLPAALRFYPAVAVFVELVLHVVPIAALVAVLGPPTGVDGTLWRIAIPVALIEAVLQAVYATSPGTAAFSAVHLTVFGVVQVWVFWRFGFVWMLGIRLAYYGLWHLAWGAARLRLLF